MRRRPFNCPTGQTFPRFDLAGPSLAADNVHGTLVMAFEVEQSSGQGQIEYVFSTDGGASWSAPKLLAPARDRAPVLPVGDRVRTGGSALAGTTRRATRATRRLARRATARPGATSACLNVRFAESADGGKTWGSSIQVTDTPTNPNYEQFGGRLVPFFGDYLTVAAQGNTIGVVWTDQRNTVGAADPAGDNDGADVAGDPETGGTCTSSFDDVLRRDRRPRSEHLLGHGHSVTSGVGQREGSAAPRQQVARTRRRPARLKPEAQLGQVQFPSAHPYKWRRVTGAQEFR